MKTYNLSEINQLPKGNFLNFKSPGSKTKYITLFNHIPEQASIFGLLKPKTAHVKHYHKEGCDIFLITKGNGLLHYGDVDKQGKLISETTVPIKEGDFYYISTYQMHAIDNTGDTDLCWVNIAPITHEDVDWFPISE